MDTDEMSKKIVDALTLMYSKLDEILHRYLEEGGGAFI